MSEVMWKRDKDQSDTSLPNRNRAALCAALRKGFLAAIRACMPKSLFRARRIVLEWTGEVRALLTVDVISERVWRRFPSREIFMCRKVLSSSLCGLPVLAPSLW